MLVYLNGSFLPEEQAVVSIFDRGLLYGDGLFEAVRIYGGHPFLWPEHARRLEEGARFLGIKSPLPSSEMERVIHRLISENNMPEAMGRIVLSRGPGPRGYSPQGADKPTLAISLHPAPTRPATPWKVIISKFTLPARDPISFFKNCNKLRQVLAKAEADAVGANEALLCNSDGFIVEGTTTNLFWISKGTVCTPEPEAGILPGTTRSHVLELCRRLGLPTKQVSVLKQDLLASEGVFLTSCGAEIVSVDSIDGIPIPQSPLPETLLKQYRS